MADPNRFPLAQDEAVIMSSTVLSGTLSPLFASAATTQLQHRNTKKQEWLAIVLGITILSGVGLCVWPVLRRQKNFWSALSFMLFANKQEHNNGDSEQHNTLEARAHHEQVESEDSLTDWLFNHGSTVVAVCLPDGCILLGNTALSQLFGWGEETVSGANLFDLCLVPADRELVREVTTQLQRDTWERFGGYLIDRRGELRWFDWQVRSILPPSSDRIFARICANVKSHADMALDYRARSPEEVYLYVGVENTERQQECELIELQCQLMQCTVARQTYPAAISAMLECLGQHLPWTYIEAWLIDSLPTSNQIKLQAHSPTNHSTKHPTNHSTNRPTHHATHKVEDDQDQVPRLQVTKTLYYCSPHQQDEPIAKYCRTPLKDRQADFDLARPVLDAIKTGTPHYFEALDHLEPDSFSRRDLALASGLNTCLIAPFGSGNTHMVCLFFATRASAELTHAATLVERITPQINLLLASKYQDSDANPLDWNFSQRPFENLVEGLFRLSLDGYYVHTNFALACMFGYETSEALISAQLNIYDQFVTESRCVKFERYLSSGSTVDNFSAELYRRDGTTIWIEAVARVMLDEFGQTVGYEGSMINITDRQRTEDKLRYGATHDDLTGLWNRAWFVEQLQRILKRARRYDRYTFAVLFVDLDNFKLINDTLGHMVGDRLLVALAQRLNGALQQGQSLARLGGDEFTLCIDRIADESEAIAIAQTLCQQLQQPFHIGSHELIACASIGIVIGSRQYETPEMVLKDADIAMYNAKARGKVGPVDESRYVVFDLEMGRASQRRLRLEDDLRRAIDYDELSLHYQPIVDLASMQTIGFEVLLRWQHSKYGAISPVEFIPIAEESGMIVKLGEWVLFQTCQQLQTWKQEGLEAGQLSLSVNVSSRQLSSGLIAQIDQALRTYDIQPGELKVEITETVVMSDLNQAKLVLKQIKERQIPILLDDFGTGYCSLNYLYELPIDTLKIDRSFVRTIDERPDRRQVLDTIFQLADSLGLKVIAEGVENLEQLAYLERQNCCYGQGYMFSKPVPAAIARTLLGQVWSKLAG
jgi:diguanylate cyclase (GGDEF)-like protein/PAS domain S-box-containing protein